MAGKDKNGLQHRVNVHENALDWLEIYEASKENKPMQRRLEDILAAIQTRHSRREFFPFSHTK
jgi:hypothetical protein